MSQLQETFATLNFEQKIGVLRGIQSLLDGLHTQATETVNSGDKSAYTNAIKDLIGITQLSHEIGSAITSLSKNQNSNIDNLWPEIAKFCE